MVPFQRDARSAAAEAIVAPALRRGQGVPLFGLEHMVSAEKANRNAVCPLVYGFVQTANEPNRGLKLSAIEKPSLTYSQELFCLLSQLVFRTVQQSLDIGAVTPDAH